MIETTEPPDTGGPLSATGAGQTPSMPVITISPASPPASTPSTPSIPSTPSTPPATTPPATTAPPSAPAAGEPPAADRVDCAKKKCIALTFDDGPSAKSGEVLDLLKDRGVKATFFVLGERVKQYPKAARRMAEDGHVVGNHSYTHPTFWSLDAAAITSEVSRTTAAIEKATGRQVTLLRPPYGESNDTVRGVERTLGLAQILWSLDSRDWATLDTDKTVSRVLKQAKPGAIVLLHEIHASTRAALPAIIDGLAKKGYTFVTVPDLLGHTKPGVSYSQRK